MQISQTRWDVLQARVIGCCVKQQQLVVTWEEPLQRGYAARKFMVLPCPKRLQMLATGMPSWLPATLFSVCQDSVRFVTVDLTVWGKLVFDILVLSQNIPISPMKARKIAVFSLVQLCLHDHQSGVALLITAFVMLESCTLAAWSQKRYKQRWIVLS